MRTVATILALMVTLESSGQNPTFFPTFTPYSQNPIINYGDELFGHPWNDPTVLKENDQYIMYTSGVEGGLTHPNDTISIYRWLSDDGYDWSLNPTDPVLESVAGTYYSGGIETPTVVFYKGEYHMYNTVYTQNTPFDFKISHATSRDGIAWQMDPGFVLEPTANLDWMSQITAEPGVMVNQDTLYLFFTAAGTVGFQSIGLVRSTDGRSFIDTTQTATLPTDVYPNGNNYAGLSTPSPVMVGDTIYLFTDVAQFVFGDNWMQVALHQFKSFSDINTWYPDTDPIHTRSDFSWTNGNFNAEIRSITPLMDGERLRVWYAGHNISSIVQNDTTNNVYFIDDELHVERDFWAIGTSEFLFDNVVTGIDENAVTHHDTAIRYYQNQGTITTKQPGAALLKIHTLDGQLLLKERFTSRLDFELDYRGLIVISVITDDAVSTRKYYSF